MDGEGSMVMCPFTDLIVLRPKTLLFFKHLGLEPQKISTMNLHPILLQLRIFIENLVKKNKKPVGASSKKTYAEEIIAALSKCANVYIRSWPQVKVWMTHLEELARQEDVNKAPRVELEETVELAMSLAPVELRKYVKTLMHVQWITMARSPQALLGLAWVGVEHGKFRFSWQKHKTKGRAGVREVWLEAKAIPEFLQAELRSKQGLMETVEHPDIIRMAIPYVKRALKGRSMSFRRSSAQDFMGHTPEIEKLMTVTNHTNPKTARRYVETLKQDLKQYPPFTAPWLRTTTTKRRKR